MARVLLCGHTFCHKCLQQCVQHLVRGGDLPCPTCRTTYRITPAGVNDIPKYVFVNSLIDATHQQVRGRDLADVADKTDKPQCTIDDCTNTAVIYCTKCEEYMCTKCKGSHGLSKYTKKHQTIPCEEVTKLKLPVCPSHEHMYLDLYCDDCQQPMCATCVSLNHNNHKCVEITTKMAGFKSQLDDVLSDTEICLKIVRQAIKATEKKAKNIKADVDDLKQQTSQSYQSIINHVLKLERQHLSDIDKCYQQIEKTLTEIMDNHQTTAAMICSTRSYGERLKQKGTVYDFITNVKSLVDRCNITNSECRQPVEARLDVVINWEECHVGVQGVKMNISDGDLEGGGGDINQVTPFTTQYQDHYGGVTGIVTCSDHLMVVHYGHDTIYIYDDNMRLENSVKVAGMSSPWGLCLVEGGAATQHLVVADRNGQCLWWLREESQAGHVRLGQPIKHKLGYRPHSVVTEINGHALVSDYDNRRLYMYSQPVQTGVCVQLPQDVKPLSAISDPSGGYVVSDEHCKLVWVTSSGQVTRRYTDQPAVSAWHMVHQGSHLLVVDSDNHCIHRVTREGGHTGHLLTKHKHNVHYPTRVWSDKAHHCLWLGHWTQDNQIIKAEYSPPHLTSLTLSTTLHKLHI